VVHSLIEYHRLSEFLVLLIYAFLCPSRKQTTKALNDLHDLKSQAKLWATQTKLIGQTEIKILLSKVDAYLQQTGHAESALLEHQNNVKRIQQEKEQIVAQLHKMDAEKCMDQAKIAELNAILRSTQDQVDTLSNQMKADASTFLTL
jgi:hypothetical protein